jgi:hypothetical protein
VSPEAHTPAQRADAVLRAAEAAAAAAQAAAAAAHAASLPEAAPPPPVVPAEPAPLPAPPVVPAEAAPPAEPPIHEAGAAGRLLAAAGDLEAHVAQARAQLDALEDALARLERYDVPSD